MFGASHFGTTYFGASYFGPKVLLSIVVKSKRPDSVSGADGGYTIRTEKVSKNLFEKHQEKILKQIMQDDEELIAIITTAINAGII